MTFIASATHPIDSPLGKLTVGVENYFKGLKDLGVSELKSFITKTSRDVFYAISLLAAAIFSWLGISVSIFLGLKEVLSPFFAALLATLPSLTIFLIVIYLFKRKSPPVEITDPIPILEIEQSGEVVAQALGEMKDVAVENFSFGSVMARRPAATLLGAFALGFLLGRNRL